MDLLDGIVPILFSQTFFSISFLSSTPDVRMSVAAVKFVVLATFKENGLEEFSFWKAKLHFMLVGANANLQGV